MNESDETLRKSPDTQAILGAIAQLSQNLVKIGADIDLIKTDVALLKSELADVKSDVAALKSDVAVLKSDVAVLKARVDNLENFVMIQFEAIQSGIVYNRVKFERLEARVFDAFSEISNMRADVTELTQFVRKQVQV